VSWPRFMISMAWGCDSSTRALGSRALSKTGDGRYAQYAPGFSGTYLGSEVVLGLLERADQSWGRDHAWPASGSGRG
jgi:hypothetical protein